MTFIGSKFNLWKMRLIDWNNFVVCYPWAELKTMMQRHVFDVTSLLFYLQYFSLSVWTILNINSHPIYIFSDDGFDKKIREITADKSGMKEVKVKNYFIFIFS